MNIDFPYHADNHGRTALADNEKHIRDMIEQILFTMPGERVNRPDFGCGLMQLVFSPGSDELTTATQFLVQGVLQRWLGELIQIDSVQAKSEESTLRVTVQYVIKSTKQQRMVKFERGVAE